MKIYSWNMLLSNAHLDRALAFIRTSDWDVFCIQEVPAAFLPELEALPFEHASAAEVDRPLDGARTTNYLVILSRLPIRNTGVIPLPYREPTMPLRGKLFTRFMYATRLWIEGLGNRHYLYADVETSTSAVRIFNLHLPLGNSVWREEEFELAMAERTHLPTIVCGDFNILEAPHVVPINWLTGGPLADAIDWRRERARIEARFDAHGFTNAHRHSVTHKFARSQLDHILVPKEYALVAASVIADSYGSDHQPIMAEIQLHAALTA